MRSARLNCAHALCWGPQFMGYLNSWSAYNSWRAAKAPGADPLLRFHADLKEALEFTSHSEEFEIEFPMFLILARKA